ncbi:hypothetical protein BCR44DRAFT_1114175 [Catenaria anguillulae PL171]|uniref:Uncharacterized protein n=1 Tax=Catenaria anguillulae PL171 TaxID=765915 RepID=A0A1Y2HPC9_9FUNG|nr:hypothetical protein BCR44DRAFT_1114175 [Catenaria anguillulae PL171]
MPLASTSTSYATLASTRPPSATLSRPPPRATTSGSTLNPSEPTKQSAAPKPAPSLRSSQLKSYLANKSHPKQPTKPAPKSQSHSKPMNPSSKPPTAVDVDGSSASRSSSSTSTSQRQSSKAATLDLKLKQIAALSAPMKRTRATLDASSSSSRATATASAIASSGGTSARPNKARKLNPPPAHQRQQSKAQRDKIRGGGSSRPTSSKPIPLPIHSQFLLAKPMSHLPRMPRVLVSHHLRSNSPTIVPQHHHLLLLLP